MSNNDDSGRSMGGESREPLPTAWRTPRAAPRVGRIGDWSHGDEPRNAGRSADDDSDEDGDEQNQPQNWFTGGERSGLSVQTPDSRRTVPGGNTVRDILRRAADSGPAPPSVGHRSVTFSGGGHTLGSDDVESQYVPDPDAPASDEATAVRHITFWREGFSVEGGELLRYDDPNNEQILGQINSGHAPPQILNVRPDQPVELRVAKRLDESYQPSPKQSFSGAGNRLGAPVPSFAPNTSAGSMPGGFPGEDASSSGTGSASAATNVKFEVDQTKPTTSVQIRLADGTRMVCRMNLTHTVLDLRNFINASRPENLTRPYTLGTTFPSRLLEDDSQTIEGAKLMNSVVVQRWV